MKTSKFIAIASLLLLPHLLPAAEVTFTFEGADGGPQFGVIYGSMNPEAAVALLRDGFIVDVVRTFPNPALHFHETDSTLNPRIPDRPFAERGVLWRDAFANQDPVVFTRSVPTAVFSLQSLVVGMTTAQGSLTTAVRVSAYLGGTLLGTVDLLTPTDGYASYSGAALGALQGVSMNRLEFIGLSNNSGADYMLDNVVLQTTDAVPPTASIASYA